ncbi:MAG: hypothetical protein J4224_02390 [Candidatus Diapherotrites archaeon]|uniref:MarR family transcriptional regulator n=1 Tax=Candidatus Iainarchaeum sp. TaxID=3101447 RepID=A0A7J4IVF7_9ARCH|nr:MAG: hypothetical protein QT03_C0001G0085 [archaeon GW2011_AR10]MBS3059252.1 hypothetical protein [Candidatus Diapherotrites archaeon]HIH08764.1 hypothetical protein [Candidatus Diapherotrites archaeon]
MKTIQLSLAAEKELAKQPKWTLMLYLQEKGELSVYEIAKELNWSTGKAHSTAKSLIASKAVKTRTIIKNGRAVKLVKLAD